MYAVSNFDIAELTYLLLLLSAPPLGIKAISHARGIGIHERRLICWSLVMLSITFFAAFVLRELGLYTNYCKCGCGALEP
jgi:hypothetical protein